MTLRHGVIYLSHYDGESFNPCVEQDSEQKTGKQEYTGRNYDIPFRL
jgi:hypothetical protein